MFDCCPKISALAAGRVQSALQALNKQGRVKEIPNAEERIRAIAKNYVESPENTLIVSPDNASRRELNVAVRQELKATGGLVAGRSYFPRLGSAAGHDWSRTILGKPLRDQRRSSLHKWQQSIGIDAGAYASVVAINPAGNQLTVEKANRELATYDPRRLTASGRTPGLLKYCSKGIDEYGCLL